MEKIKDRNLYLVITEGHCSGRSAIDVAGSAIAGGVDIIQMREKNKSRDELLMLGKNLARLCEDNKVPFIVNDDPNLAKDVGARGVHLGQEDVVKYPLKRAREILGLGSIVGVSTHSVKQFAIANEEDFDYIAFGPIFETKTKDYFLGTKNIEEVVRLAKRPVFFIGGINLSNIEEILRKGARRIALIRAIAEAENIKTRTEEFKSALNLT